MKTAANRSPMECLQEVADEWKGLSAPDEPDFNLLVDCLRSVLSGGGHEAVRVTARSYGRTVMVDINVSWELPCPR